MSKLEKFRFSFIQRFDRIFKNQYCWADCVSWAYNFRVKDYNPFNIELAKTCRQESEESSNGTCYCGRFYKGLAISELTEQQLEAARRDSLTAMEVRNIKTLQQMNARHKEQIVFIFMLLLVLIIGVLAPEAAFVASINF